MIPALLLAAAVILSGATPGVHRRLRQFTPPIKRAARRPISQVTVVRSLAICTGIAIAILLGNLLGVILGAGACVVMVIVLSRSIPRSARRRVNDLQRQAPQVADLLAACMASGATIHAAVSAVARAVDSPMSEEMQTVERALRLGAENPWEALAPSSLARAMQRSLSSGAPLADVLPIIAGELRRDARLRAEAAARTAGVRAVLPLVACFLPAFLLVGVVPVVASLAQGLWQ